MKEKWRVNQHFREGVGDRDAILVAVREVVGALAAKDADEAAGRWRGAKIVEALGLHYPLTGPLPGQRAAGGICKQLGWLWQTLPWLGVGMPRRQLLRHSH